MQVTRPQTPQVPICPLFTAAKMMNSAILGANDEQRLTACIGGRCAFWVQSEVQMPDGKTHVLGACGQKQGPSLAMGVLTQLAELTQVQAIAAGIVEKPKAQAQAQAQEQEKTS